MTLLGSVTATATARPPAGANPPKSSPARLTTRKSGSTSSTSQSTSTNGRAGAGEEGEDAVSNGENRGGQENVGERGGGGGEGKVSSLVNAPAGREGPTPRDAGAGCNCRKSRCLKL